MGDTCNNASQSYFLNININGADQTPRRRLVVFDFLRKDVHETTNASIEAEIIKVRTGFKDLNKIIWQSKLDYAREFANATLIAQQKIALKLIATTTTTTGESTEFKIIKLQQASEQAKTLIDSEFEIAQAKILEAKNLALLNGETQADLEEMESEANLHLTSLNLTSQEQKIVIEQALNDSIAEVEANDDGKRFAIKDAGGSLNLSSGNITTTGTGFFGFLGSLVKRITKLWVVNIDASNDVVIGRNLEVAENTTLKNDLLVKNNAVIQGDLEAGKGKLKLSTTDDRVTIIDVLRLKPRPKAPGNASLGDIYVDTTSRELCFFDGQNWIGVAKNETCS